MCWGCTPGFIGPSCLPSKYICDASPITYKLCSGWEEKLAGVQTENCNSTTVVWIWYERVFGKLDSCCQLKQPRLPPQPNRASSQLWSLLGNLVEIATELYFSFCAWFWLYTLWGRVLVQLMQHAISMLISALMPETCLGHNHTRDLSTAS